MNHEHVEMLRKSGVDEMQMIDAVIQRDTPYSLDWIIDRVEEHANTVRQGEQIVADVLSEVDADLNWVNLGVVRAQVPPSGHSIEVQTYTAPGKPVRIGRELEGTYLDPESDEESTGATIEADGPDRAEETDSEDGHGSSRSATIKFLQAKMEKVGQADARRYGVPAGPCHHAREKLDDGSYGKTKAGDHANRRLPRGLKQSFKALRRLGIITDEGTPACSKCKYEYAVDRAAELVVDDLPVAGIAFVPAAPELPRTLLYRRPETLPGSDITDVEEFRAGLPVDTVGQIIEAVLDHQDGIEYDHDKRRHVVTITDYQDGSDYRSRHPGWSGVVEPHEIGESHGAHSDNEDMGTDDSSVPDPQGISPDLMPYRPRSMSVEVDGITSPVQGVDLGIDEAPEMEHFSTSETAEAISDFEDAPTDMQLMFSETRKQLSNAELSLIDMQSMLSETRKQLLNADPSLTESREDEDGSASGEAEE